MMQRSYLFLIAALLLFSACGKTYFTQSVKARVQRTSDANIEKVQFYNDKRIVLEYKTTARKDEVKGGKVTFKEGVYHYYIEIPENTHAVAKHVDETKMRVFFEDGEDRSLIFGTINGKEYYQLFGLYKNKKFTVEFEGRTFEIIEGSDAKLLIKKNLKIERETKVRKVKGVKVK